MSLAAAVGTDTYGGLTGFKRPVAGNPARVPTNLPAFRGVPNKPGANIKTPAIKSSANHPDRKTNVCIPYARITPYEGIADIGRLQPGDVAFISKTRPGVPGYAHARETRLAGVDALNRWQGPDFWYMKNETNTYRYILVNPVRTGDDWRKVPSLGEWTLDGIVLSSEDRDLYKGAGASARDNELYNIAIQGPCTMNNGFIEETTLPGELKAHIQGQVARFTQLFAPGYMDHRVERFGTDVVTVDQRFDFAADYKGAQYHLYPLQMFDRDIRPMNELYCGLVATEYKYDSNETKKIATLVNVEKVMREARDKANVDYEREVTAYKVLVNETSEAKRALNEVVYAIEAREADMRPVLDEIEGLTQGFMRTNPGKARGEFVVPQYFATERDRLQLLLSDAKSTYDAKKVAYDAAAQAQGTAPVRRITDEEQQANDRITRLRKSTAIARAWRAKSAYEKMGWVNPADGEPKANAEGEPAPASFCAFRWVLFTSQQAWRMADETEVKTWAPPGEPPAAKRHKKEELGRDPFDNETARKSDFRNMVGAYHIGKVLDMKAGKMPWFEGGPMETGFKVTTNVNLKWLDWRALRREYSPVDTADQFGMDLTGCDKWVSNTGNAAADAQMALDSTAVFNWPSAYYSRTGPEANFSVDLASGAKKTATDGGLSAAEEKGVRDAKVSLNNPVSMDLVYTEKPDAYASLAALTKLNSDNYDAAYGKGGADPSAPVVLRSLPQGRLLPSEEDDEEIPGGGLTFERSLARLVPNLRILPPQAERTHSHLMAYLDEVLTHIEKTQGMEVRPLTGVAQYVTAPTAPVAPAAASTAAGGSSSIAAPSAPLRRRAGNTPEPSPDRACAVGASIGALPATSLAPVIEAPSAPTAQAAGGKKRRGGASQDVFSSIFGASDTGSSTMQPLNPAHRPEGGGSAAAPSGRSYQRRKGGAGGSKESKE